MRTLVTGGTGFVGANLVRRLLQDGHDVTLIVRDGFNPWRIEGIQTDIELVHADLADRSAVERAFRSTRPEWVFHLAVHGAYPTQTDPTQVLTTNVLGTSHLVGAAVQTDCQAFVNAGSSSEYGLKDHAPVESEYIEPNSTYAVAKAAATMLCRQVARATGLHVPTLRLYSAYGPYEEPTRLVPALILRGLDGTFPPLANPKIARDYVHVDDVCTAFIRAATIPGQEPGAVYNIGSGIQTSLADIVGIVATLFDISDRPSWGSMGDRAWDTDTWVSNCSAAKEALGWDARISLSDGLADTADWFRANPELCTMYLRSMVPISVATQS